jgi:hypothetical protein
MAAVQPVRRCKWCIKRTGAARYFMAGQWRKSFLMAVWVSITKPKATDGMCPDCFAQASAEAIAARELRAKLALLAK